MTASIHGCCWSYPFIDTVTFIYTFSHFQFESLHSFFFPCTNHHQIICMPSQITVCHRYSRAYDSTIYMPSIASVISSGQSFKIALMKISISLPVIEKLYKLKLVTIYVETCNHICYLQNSGKVVVANIVVLTLWNCRLPMHDYTLY